MILRRTRPPAFTRGTCPDAMGAPPEGVDKPDAPGRDTETRISLASLPPHVSKLLAALDTDGDGYLVRGALPHRGSPAPRAGGMAPRADVSRLAGCQDAEEVVALNDSH